MITLSSVFLIALLQLCMTFLTFSKVHLPTLLTNVVSRRTASIMHVQVLNECYLPADNMQVIDAAAVCRKFAVANKIKRLKCTQTFWLT